MALALWRPPLGRPGRSVSDLSTRPDVPDSFGDTRQMRVIRSRRCSVASPGIGRSRGSNIDRYLVGERKWKRVRDQRKRCFSHIGVEVMGLCSSPRARTGQPCLCSSAVALAFAYWGTAPVTGPSLRPRLALNRSMDVRKPFRFSTRSRLIAGSDTRSVGSMPRATTAVSARSC